MAIDFNTDFDPRYGEMVELSPLIRRVVAKNPNPFTFTGTGVYLIGRGDVTVIDPGPTLEVHLDAIEAAIGPDESIGRILVTHTHTDHTAGVTPLAERTGATVVGCGPHGEVGDDPTEAVRFDEYFTAEELERFDAEYAEVPDELKREGPDVDFVADVELGDGDVIEADGHRIEAVATPGHTSNHLCFALADESVLFTGDHVMGWATSVISPPDGDLYDYMASLEKLLDRSDSRYWPTHGPAIDQPQNYVRSFIDHRRSREAQILQALTTGPAAIVDLVPSMYAEVDKRLWRAAANSVYSHLLALYRQQRVAADGPEAAGAMPSITATWRLAGS